MSSVIDAAFYPHVLERVTAYAPYVSLLRLRAVSRSLRARADALLAADRITITAAPIASLNQVSETRDAENLPPLQPGEAPEPDMLGELPLIVTSEHGRLPAFASWALHDPRQWKDLTSIVSLEYTRAVDLVGPAVSGPLQILLASERHPPLTIRVLPDEALRDIYTPTAVRDRPKLRIPSAHTLVRFASLPQLFDDSTVIDLDRHDIGRRIVHHITLHPDDDMWVYNLPHLNIPRPSAEHDDVEVVYIFALAEEGTEWPPRQIPLPWTATVHDVYNLLVSCTNAIVRYLWKGVGLTIVGIEGLEGHTFFDNHNNIPHHHAPQVDQTAAGGAEPIVQQKLVQRCRDLAMEGLGGWERDPVDSRPDSVSAALKKMRFFGVEEYRTHVGPERAALETTLSGTLD